MKKAVAFLAVLGLVAVPAMADFMATSPVTHGGKTASQAGALPPVNVPRTGEVLVVDIAGVGSWDGPVGDPSNEVYVIDLALASGRPSGTPLAMNGIGWDVTIETIGASWLSEAAMYFDDNIAPDGTGLILRPGAGQNRPGAAGGEFFSSGGIIKLSDAGIPDVVLPDGKLRLEFYETYEDFEDALDASYLLPSTLTIQFVPEPATLALLGLGAFALLRRRG